MPAISVVIPTYNSAAYLPHTLDSILRQAFTDYEIVVVDDCSTDNTKEIVKAVCDPRVRYIRLAERHGGPSRPRNEGVKAARADIISFLDSDDIMRPGRLGPELALLKACPTVGFVFTNAEKFKNDAGERLGAFLDGYEAFNNLTKHKTAIPGTVTISSHDAYECLFHENFVLSGGTVPRHVLEDVGLFDEQLTSADDWDMWLRISHKYDIGYLDRIGFRYRVRSGSVSTRGVSLALNRNSVVEKQIRAGLSRKLLEQAGHLLATNHRDAGYCYQSVDDFANARRHYLQSLKHETNWFAARGLGISLLGPRLVRMLKRARRAYSSTIDLPLPAVAPSDAKGSS